MKLTRSSKKMSMPLALTWSFRGVNYQVTPWPETQFQRVCAEGWIVTHPSTDVLAAADLALETADWLPYLEFAPLDVREFLLRFTSGRMAALQVAAQCPALLTVLTEVPALATFLSGHGLLRGTGSRWDEINAVNERSGVFGVLEWLGLPSSRQTLAILRAITDPAIPHRWLEPLRTQLWEPRSISALQQMPTITGKMLAQTCHALAA